MLMRRVHDLPIKVTVKLPVDRFNKLQELSLGKYLRFISKTNWRINVIECEGLPNEVIKYSSHYLKKYKNVFSDAINIRLENISNCALLVRVLGHLVNSKTQIEYDIVNLGNLTFQKWSHLITSIQAGEKGNECVGNFAPGKYYLPAVKRLSIWSSDMNPCDYSSVQFGPMPELTRMELSDLYTYKHLEFQFASYARELNMSSELLWPKLNYLRIEYEYEEENEFSNLFWFLSKNAPSLSFLDLRAFPSNFRNLQTSIKLNLPGTVRTLRCCIVLADKINFEGTNLKELSVYDDCDIEERPFFIPPNLKSKRFDILKLKLNFRYLAYDGVWNRETLREEFVDVVRSMTEVKILHVEIINEFIGNLETRDFNTGPDVLIINEKRILDRKVPEAIWKRAQVLMPKLDCQAAI